jgi:hypothetical protein
MAEHEVWPSLNFITAGDLQRLARDAGLQLLNGWSDARSSRA